MELTYTKCGDYLIPNLVLSDTKEYHIGNMAGCAVPTKNTGPFCIPISLSLKSCFPHLEEIDTACRERLEIMKKP